MDGTAPEGGTPRAPGALAVTVLTPDVFSAVCPTRVVLDRVADKWTVLVLALLERGPLRFNALRRAVDGVSQKVLSQLLKGLERDGLVTRTAFPTVPVTVEYAITPLGLTLAARLAGLAAWAEENIGAVTAAQAAFDERAARAARGGWPGPGRA